jgi:hypothetical protein
MAYGGRPGARNRASCGLRLKFGDGAAAVRVY